MKPRKRWPYLAAALAALVVAAAVAQSVRQGSWAPVTSVAWLPAVIAAIWPGSGGPTHLPSPLPLGRRRTPAG